MGVRITVLIFGLALCGLAFGLLVPDGLVGAQLSALNLGPFAAQQAPLGAMLAAVGAVLSLSAILPGQRGAKQRRKGVRPIRPLDLLQESLTVSTFAPANDAPAFTPVLAPQTVEAPTTDPTPNPFFAAAEPVFEEAPRPSEAAVMAPIVAAPAVESPFIEAPAPQLVVAEAIAAEPVIEDAEFTEAAPDIAVTPPAHKPPMETFEVVRTRLRQQVRGEVWSEAAETARRLPTLAANDRERMLAAQDIGDFARAHGRLDDASEAYDEALSYARVLHTAAPTDPAKATLLADALVNSGDMAQEQGRLDSAIVSYEEAVALRREAAEASPDTHALRVLSVTLERLADAREDRGHRMRALGLYRESHQIASQLASLNPARYHSDLAITEQRLAELQTRIGA